MKGGKSIILRIKAMMNPLDKCTRFRSAKGCFASCGRSEAHLALQWMSIGSAGAEAITGRSKNHAIPGCLPKSERIGIANFPAL